MITTATLNKVDCYIENRTPEVEQIIKRLNAKLSEL